MSSQPLFADWCWPCGAPEIARTAKGIVDLLTVPLIAVSLDDWNWRLWTSTQKLDFAQLNLRHQFDIDDAAIAAA